MSRTINLMIRDDGVATIYDDTYDITIHCENEEEQHKVVELLKSIPSAEPEYEPAKLEDFAKTMSENTLYSFMAWYGEALELMERHGFVICKKTM